MSDSSVFRQLSVNASQFATRQRERESKSISKSHESESDRDLHSATCTIPTRLDQSQTLSPYESDQDAVKAIYINTSATQSNANSSTIPEVCPANAESRSANPTLQPGAHRHSRTASAGLHVLTDLGQPSKRTPPMCESIPQLETAEQATSLHTSSTEPIAIPFFNRTLRPTASSQSLRDCLSPSSALGSPALAAMIDITPLPSPLYAGDSSPKMWGRERALNFAERRLSSAEGMPSPKGYFMLSTSPASPPRKRKGYASLMPAAVEAQTANVLAAQQNANLAASGRNRTLSDFVPEQLHNVRQRVATFGPSGIGAASDSRRGSEQLGPHMHREENLAAQRGLIIQPASAPAKINLAPLLPSPPPSSKSASSSDPDEDDSFDGPQSDVEAGVEYFAIHTGDGETQQRKRKRHYRAVRPLGQGTFSKVVLATRQRLPRDAGATYTEAALDPARLVAIKIVEHGPAGGADEERIETSLKREVDVLKSVSHPSIVRLKALEYGDVGGGRALLVLTYCPGGDLFEFATEKRECLTAGLVQRMFAELVGAVRYLHENLIVHRDIKLENVLVNLPASALTPSALPHPQTHPTPLVTLTDLGLSRRIPPPPASPLLTTRCGSEDYAAPELLLGQPYDGRSTDAWALGVLLYALVEGRLPFDAPPGKPDRSRNTHRIARCDWIWGRFGDEDGEWDEGCKGIEEWEGARVCVEGLLKKVRMGRLGLGGLSALEWVKRGVDVEGGLVRGFGEEEEVAEG